MKGSAPINPLPLGEGGAVRRRVRGVPRQAGGHAIRALSALPSRAADIPSPGSSGPTLSLWERVPRSF